MARKIVLFDLDGTLWDSYPWYAAVSSSLGPKSADDILACLRGGGSIVSIVLDEGISRPRFRRQCLTELSRLKLYSGVQDTLQTLKENGTSTGVVTSLPKWLAEPLLRESGLTPFFDVMQFFAQKPSPSGILSAIHALDGEPSAAVYYIGDMENDASAAERAGVNFGWASYGYGTNRPANTALVLNKFVDVLGV